MAYQPFDLSGKTALVTGGNSGIGLGFAEALAQSGAAVCIWGTNAQKNAAALEKLRSHGVSRLVAWFADEIEPYLHGLHEVIFDLLKDAFFARIIFGGKRITQLLQQFALFTRELVGHAHFHVDIKIAAGTAVDPRHAQALHAHLRSVL